MENMKTRKKVFIISHPISSQSVFLSGLNENVCMSIPIYNLQDGNINQGSIDSYSHSSTLLLARREGLISLWVNEAIILEM